MKFPEYLTNNYSILRHYSLDNEITRSSYPLSADSMSPLAVSGVDTVIPEDAVAVPVTISGIRGINYLPNTTSTYYYNHQIFLSPPSGSFVSGSIATELDTLSGLGIKHLRVFQNMYGFAVDRDQHVANLSTFANMCKTRDIKIILVMFDGVGAEFFHNNITAEWFSPWYHLISTNGSGNFDPASRTNHQLVANTSSGWLRNFTRSTETFFNSYLEDSHPYTKWGNWFAGPGSTYIATRSIAPSESVLASNYPQFPTDSDHSGMWQLMMDYIDETMNVFSGASLTGTLHSIDLMNEPEVGTQIFSDNPYLSAFMPISVITEFYGRMPIIQTHCYDKFANFLSYWTKHIHVDHPNTPVTIGFFDVLQGAYMLLKMNTFGSSYLPDYYSFHSYGDGWLMSGLASQLSGDLQNSLANISQAGVLPITELRPAILNEVWRSDRNTDESLKWTLRYMNSGNVGVVMWAPFYTPAFNIAVEDRIHQKPSGTFSYTYYPGIGIYHYNSDNTLVARNQDTISYISGWCHSGYTPIPSRYIVYGPHKWSYAYGKDSVYYRIQEITTSGVYATGVNTKIHWLVSKTPTVYTIEPHTVTGSYNVTYMPDVNTLFTPHPLLGLSEIKYGGDLTGNPTLERWSELIYYGSGTTSLSYDFVAVADGDYLIQAWISNSGAYDPDNTFDSQYFIQAHPIRTRVEPIRNSLGDFRAGNRQFSWSSEYEDEFLNETASGVDGPYLASVAGLNVGDISNVRGCNYICNAGYSGYRVNWRLFLDHTGLGAYDPIAIQDDLDIFEGYGIEYIRAWSSLWGYFTNRTQYINNLTTFANECSGRNIKIILTLFDGVVHDGAVTHRLWYDYLGTGAHTGWHPLSGINPGLANAAGTGQLQYYDTQVASNQALLQPIQNFQGGDWIGSPGAIYVCGYNHVTGGYVDTATPGYPDGPEHTTANQLTRHSGFWQGMIDYVRDTCNVFTGALSGTLHSIDIMNEPDADIPGSLNAIWNFFDPQFNLDLYIEFNALYPIDYFQFPGAAETLTRLKLLSFLSYWNDLIHNEYNYLTTIGWTNVGEAGVNTFVMVDTYDSQVDYISAHDYGHGYFWDNTLNFVDFNSGAFNRQSCINEAWVIPNGGDEGLLWNMYHAAKRKAGLLHWELFETPTFGMDIRSIVNPLTPSAQPTGGFGYPATGLVRRKPYYDGAYHTGNAIQTVYRRPDISGYMNRYYTRQPLSEPETWFVEGVSFVNPGEPNLYRIVNQWGNIYPIESGQTVHWRRVTDSILSGVHPAYGGRISINGSDGLAFSFNTATPLSLKSYIKAAPSAGLWLDTTSVSTTSEPTFTLEAQPGEANKDIILAAYIHHSGIINFNNYDNLAVTVGYPKRVRVKEYFEFDWYQSFYTNSNKEEWSGGPISDVLATSEYISNLGPMMSSIDTETYKYYYRKVFLKSSSSEIITSARVYLEDVQFTGQVKIALQKVYGDAAQNLYTLPNGFASGDFVYVTGYNNGLSYGQLDPNDEVGVWIQFALPNIEDSSRLLEEASFKITIEGY